MPFLTSDFMPSLKEATVAGSLASLASLAVLAARGRAETGDAAAPVNAPSHWLWGKVALRQNDPSLRFTLTGFLIHHASGIFWGMLHALAWGRRRRTRPASALLREAAATTALAALVDLRLVPERLTPGFERRLSTPSLVLVYSLFGLGLAAGSYLIDRARR